MSGFANQPLTIAPREGCVGSFHTVEANTRVVDIISSFFGSVQLDRFVIGCLGLVDFDCTFLCAFLAIPDGVLSFFCDSWRLLSLWRFCYAEFVFCSLVLHC